MNVNQYDFDLFVIGGGSGGVRAARIASQLGAKVAIAEEHQFGGTCVIRGCVPKKLMVYASHFYETFEDAKGFGWTFHDLFFSWSSLIQGKNQEIGSLNFEPGSGLHDAPRLRRTLQRLWQQGTQKSQYVRAHRRRSAVEIFNAHESVWNC